MLKTLLSAFLLSALFLVSCNYQANNEQTTVKDEEKQLKDDINNYPDSFALKDKLIGYYQQNNDYIKALSTADSLLKKDSANARLWDIKANLYSENNDTPDAIHSFEKAVQLYPSPEFMKPLGYLYAETNNLLALSVADTLYNNPKYDSKEEALFIKGVYYSSAGNKPKAINYFDTCSALNYNDMFSYREKAMCFYDLGKYNNALQVLQKAVSINTAYDEAYYWMGRCYEKLGNNDEAIKNYQLALQIDKNYIEAKEALAKLQAS